MGKVEGKEILDSAVLEMKGRIQRHQARMINLLSVSRSKKLWLRQLSDALEELAASVISITPITHQGQLMGPLTVVWFLHGFAHGIYGSMLVSVTWLQDLSQFLSVTPRIVVRWKSM